MSYFAVLSLDQSDRPNGMSHTVSLFCQEKFVIQLNCLQATKKISTNIDGVEGGRQIKAET